MTSNGFAPPIDRYLPYAMADQVSSPTIAHTVVQVQKTPPFENSCSMLMFTAYPSMLPGGGRAQGLYVHQSHTCYCYKRGDASARGRGGGGANLAENAYRVSKEVEAAYDLVQLP